MATFGQLVHTRRQAQRQSLAALSRAMGGSPSESFLWRVEEEESAPSPTVVIKLARALRLSEELLLNAAGHATSEQQAAALAKLSELVGEPAPVSVAYDVLDPDTGEPTREKATHVMRAREKGFVIRLSGQADAIFDGECVVSTERMPVEGMGVIIKRNGRLSSSTYHTDGGKVWLTRGEEKLTEGYEIKGVILRVITRTSWE